MTAIVLALSVSGLAFAKGYTPQIASGHFTLDLASMGSLVGELSSMSGSLVDSSKSGASLVLQHPNGGQVGYCYGLSCYRHAVGIEDFNDCA